MILLYSLLPIVVVRKTHNAVFFLFKALCVLQRCYWSDMFTGRLRSEIPTALVRISDTGLCSFQELYVMMCCNILLLFLCIHQRSLGSALMSAGARLTELDLSDNAFGPDGVKGIEQLLKGPSCHTLRELRLNNCGMGIGGGKVRFNAVNFHALPNSRY